jgi:hypothetical protein
LIPALFRGSAALSRQARPTREGSPLGHFAQLATLAICVSSSKSAVAAGLGRHGKSAVGVRLKVLAADPSGRWRPVTPGYPYPFVAGHVAVAVPNAILAGDIHGLAGTQLVGHSKLRPRSLANSQKAVWRIEHHRAHNIGSCAGRGGLSLLWLWRSLPWVRYALASTSNGGVLALSRPEMRWRAPPAIVRRTDRCRCRRPWPGT